MASSVNIITLAACICALAASSVHAARLKVLSAAPSIKLPDRADVSTSQVVPILERFLGVSASEGLDWNGKESLWSRPEAAVIITIRDIISDGIPLNFVKNYPLDVDSDFPSAQTNAEALALSFSDKGSVWLTFEHQNVVSNIKEKLNLIPPAENSIALRDSNKLAQELSLLSGLSKWASSEKASILNSVPDFYSIEISSLGDFDLDSESRKEAERLISEAINKLVAQFRETYSNNVVIVAVNMPVEKVRVVRQTSTDSNKADTPVGLYEFYHADYPVAFNIILFLGIFLSIAILSIAIWMWFMDPGRDSLIYRMTQTRSKRD